MSGSTTNQTILSASAFVSSIGVNTHVGYGTGSYNNLALVEADLTYLGVTNLRDGLATSPEAQPVLDGLAAAGYKFDFVVPSTVPASGTAGLQQYLVSLNQFEAAHPGSITAVEGLNEANLQAFSYNGSSSIAAAAQFQTAYYDAVKGDASLDGVSVYNMTLAYNAPSDFAGLGNLSASSNDANSHAYVSTSTTPQAALAQQLSLADSVSPGNPTVITETGYTTLSSTPYLGVDQTVQAKSILDTLVDAFKDGVSTTYLYELLDQNSSSTDTNPQDHFGLFNSDGTPKLAATAIHNLTTILADNGTGGHMPTAPLGYTLTNLPSSGNSMVLAKSNGAYDLVVWAEPPVWNATTGTEISNPTNTVTVTLGSVHQSVNVYDPLDGTTPVASYTNVSSFTIPVSDHPVIVEIDAPPAANVTPTVIADVSGTAVEIVAQLAALNASTSLSEINLTDTHVLPVASLSTMDYIISNYGKALAAIQGGYSFSVTNSTSAWTQTQIFNASGTLSSTTTSNYGSNGVITSTVTVNADQSTDSILYTAGIESQQSIVSTSGSVETIDYNTSGQITSDTIQNTDGSSSTAVYTNGVETKLYVTNANGSHTYSFYDITGQAYTTQILQLTAAGVVTSTVEKHADGSLAYTRVVNADGSITTDLYNSVGQKTTEIDNYTTGSSLTTDYNTSGAVTETVAVAANGSTTTTNYTAGVEASIYITNANGSKETELFTNGQLTSEFVQNTDGSSSTAVYSNGVETALYTTNANGTHTYSFYDVTGQAYTTQIVQLTAGLVATSTTDLYANGSPEYTKVLNSDGSTTTDLYNSAGQKTSEIDANASGVVTKTISDATNGTVTTTNYTAGVEASVYIANANGSKETQLFTNGQLTSDLVQNTDGSSSNALYSNGVETKVYITNANGSHTYDFYHITGQAYTTQIMQLTAGLAVTSITDLHSNGSLEYTQVVNADGSTTTDLYNSAGQKTTEIDHYTNGSSLTDYYNTSGSITQTVADATNGSVTTTSYTAGVETSLYITNTNGSKQSELFTNGQMTSNLIQNADGSSSNTLYSNGVETKEYVINANGSRDNYYYNTSGVEHDSYNSASQLVYTDILNNNGTHTETAGLAGVTLTGGTVGGDTFTSAGAGSTTIAYTTGNDVINNFHAGTAANHDTIQIAQSLVSAYAQLQISQSGANTLIHISATDSITLKSVVASSLSHSDFVFA